MINTERISAWLEAPHHLQEIAPEAIRHLAKEYPFFTPAHYFLWINGNLDKDAKAQIQQSNPVNPIMLGNLLQAAYEPPVLPETIMEEDNIVETLPQTEAKEVVEIPAAKEEPLVETMPEMEGKTIVTDAPKVSSIPPIMEEKMVEAEESYKKEQAITDEDLSFIQPASSEDYFLQQGIKVSNDIPDFAEEEVGQTDEEKALMVVMSFAEWLKHISSKSKKAKEEQDDQRALKTMWQQQKLAAAIEEESDEIPEQVFEMAVNSIARKEELVSESLANVYAKQGKIEKAIEMYQKLSLQNPEKNAYFAAKIENLQKEI